MSRLVSVCVRASLALPVVSIYISLILLKFGNQKRPKMKRPEFQLKLPPRFCFASGYAFSEDGEYLAYGTSASGSDWVEIHFLRVEGAVLLDDRLERVKFSCMSWTHDGKGLFYNSYPEQEGKSDGKAAGAVATGFKLEENICMLYD